MASTVCAAVAGYVGRAEQKGEVGVFTRKAGSGQWQHVLSEHEAFTVVAHPTDPNIVFAGTADGVFRSTDGGGSFQRTNFPDRGRQIWSFLVDATNRSLIYAGASPIGIYRSEDCGETWRSLPDPGMPNRAVMPFACRVMRMAQHPQKPATIYAALEVNGVMRTDDGGETWHDCSTDLIRLAQLPHLRSKIVSDTFNEGMLDGHAIAISPTDPDRVVLAVRMGLFESDDQGATWRDMQVGRFSPTTYGRDIRISPQDGDTLYAALSVAAASHDGGLYRSSDKGSSWQRFDKVQVHGTIMSVALHPSNPASVYLGARYNGEVFGTEDGGVTWDALPLPEGVKDIYAIAAA